MGELLRSVKFHRVENQRNRYLLSDHHRFTGRKFSHCSGRLKNPDKLFHCKHGHLRSAVSSILDTFEPVQLAQQLIVAYLWSAWSGLVYACPLLWWRFHCCFESESDSDRGGSIWIRGISTPFPTHQIQAVFLLHSHHVDSCRNCPFARLVRRQDRRIPRGNLV